MSKPHFIISELDKSMLNSGRRVGHPSEVGPLVYDLPADTSNMHVVAAYHVALNDPRGHVTCAWYGHTENHRRGVVVALGNGTYAPIGKNCCDNKLGYEYQELLDAFTDDNRRTRLLSSLQTIFDLFPAMNTHMQSLPSLPQIQEALGLHKRLLYHFSGLCQFFGSSRGRLERRVQVRDADAMAERKARRDNKANQLIEAMAAEGKKIERADLASYFPNDPDFRETALTKTEMRLDTLFAGTYFFNGFERVVEDLKVAAKAIFDLVWAYNWRASREFENGELGKSLAAIERAINKAIDLIDRINAGLAMFDRGGSIEAMMTWARDHSDAGLRLGGTYGWEPGSITCSFASGPARRVTYATMAPLSTAPLKAIQVCLRQGGSQDVLAA